jgi:hypothetical protein
VNKKVVGVFVRFFVPSLGPAFAYLRAVAEGLDVAVRPALSRCIDTAVGKPRRARNR